MNVLLVIRSLNVGGAERQVVTLAKSLTAPGHRVHIAVFTGGGALEDELVDNPSIKLHVLNRHRIVGLPSIALQVRKLVHSESCDVVYGFLPIPNLSLLGTRLMKRRPRIVWGVRSSNLDLGLYSRKVRWSMTLERWTSRFADVIVANSLAARSEYVNRGYPERKFVTIHNAIDVERFKPEPGIRHDVRKQLGIPDAANVIGLFARIHPKKDHETFLRACAIALRLHPDLHFLCAGGFASGDSDFAESQKMLANGLGLAARVHWLGERSDPERLMNACTITTLSSSSGEGFPNSVAESAACGIPCVTTNSGDARIIVSDDRLVVQPRDPGALASAWSRLLNMQTDELVRLGLDMRSSIVERFSPDVITRKTSSILAGQ